MSTRTESMPNTDDTKHLDRSKCWVLSGPTACGKTATALEIARLEPVEIVSVDSMQVYTGMDIGTAKPSLEQRARVPHHMIDVLDPEQSCNVGFFCRMALECIREIRARGRRPLLVGGTPLYLKGMIWGLMEAPGSHPAIRRRLRATAREHGSDELHRRLAEVDPEAAERIHPNDVHRLVRALEVHEVTGEPISARRDQFEGEPVLDHSMVCLAWPREVLYSRINHRVDEMLERGLVEEVRRLRDRLGPQAGKALGYRQITAFLDGKMPLAEAVRLIKRDTRRYAKHQTTWFRHFPQVEWVDAAVFGSAREVAGRCLELFI